MKSEFSRLLISASVLIKADSNLLTPRQCHLLEIIVRQFRVESIGQGTPFTLSHSSIVRTLRQGNNLRFFGVVRDDDDDMPLEDTVAFFNSRNSMEGNISVTESSPSIVKFSMSTKFSSLR